ncbi:MAG: glycosyltransferase family 2 protein [Spirosomataceae bacterium]
MISVLIPTKNEENDLMGCLDSLKWCDDIYILDSFSTDKTEAIAKEFGTHFYQRVFDDYSSQKNFGLNHLPFKYDWILLLDADERVPEGMFELWLTEISKVDVSVDGFLIRRKDYLFGQWLKHSQMTSHYLRLIRKGKGQFHRAINEVLEVEGEVKTLPGHFDHFPFSKGIAHWIQKHNVYSSMEAQRWYDEQSGQFDFSVRKALFSKTLPERRYHQKGLFYKVPFRPFIKFIYLYVVKKGILDGYPGLVVSILQSIYEYFIVLKSKEILLQNKS